MLTLEQLNQYRSPIKHNSLLRGIPIELLDAIKSHYASLDKPIRIRYRGPRRVNGHTGKVSNTGRLTCLKADATHFSVYRR